MAGDLAGYRGVQASQFFVVRNVGTVQVQAPSSRLLSGYDFVIRYEAAVNAEEWGIHSRGGGGRCRYHKRGNEN
eukprot:CAMPEP_0182461122 /NCGR_PEP_ID=MMETSP1319-20130603/5781_1 /TAXON_ID=172717 /ORGANISM="Bolidomonas pacifica, Strain RCC208" /LENGTH=73 /DNA_ID=CAMNT_0024660345 /DNA_START=137 /DNA_END=358 /DNA_ORIENTATION=-